MKKFLASLLGIVVFFLLVFSCNIIIAREIMSEKTMKAVIEVIPELIEEENSDKSMVESFIEQIEGVDPELAKYYDDEELTDEIAKMFSSALENLGNPDSEYLIDTTSFEQYILQGINEYEKETGFDIDDAVIEEMFDEINEENNITREELGIDEYLFIFETIQSNTILLSLISGIVLCIIIMFILLANIHDTLLKVKTPFIVNGIGALVVGGGLTTLLTEIEVNGSFPLDKIAQILTTPFFKVGIISTVIGIALIIIAHVLKHNKSISNSNAALENLGNVNYVPNNNISNTPYNGYQNH